MTVAGSPGAMTVSALGLGECMWPLLIVFVLANFNFYFSLLST